VLLGSFRLTSFCNLEASICIDIDQSLALTPTISGYRRSRRGWLRGSTSANGSDVSASKALLVTEGPSNVKSALASFAYQDHVRLARDLCLESSHSSRREETTPFRGRSLGCALLQGTMFKGTRLQGTMSRRSEVGP
jgi:hypothetical protein